MRNTKKYTYISLLSMTALLFSACASTPKLVDSLGSTSQQNPGGSSSTTGSDGTRQISDPNAASTPTVSTSPSPTPPSNSTGTPVIYNFTEPNTDSKKLDVLFIIHATGSFNGQLSSGVVAGLSNFVAALGSGIDYQIGVMLGYPSGANSGTLFNASANGATGPVLSSSTMTIGAIQTALQNDINNAPTVNISAVDPNGDLIQDVHGEFGTLSLLNAVQNNLNSIRSDSRANYNFFRPGAALAIVFAANESDNCFLPANDTDTQEQTLKVQFCGSGSNVVSVNSVEKAVQVAQNGSPYLFGFLGYGTDPLDSLGNVIDEEEAGHGYLDIVSQTSGVLANLDPGSKTVSSSVQNSIIQAGLQSVGNLANNKLQLKTVFQLNAGAIASSIQVFLNNSQLSANQFSYDATANAVTVPGVSALATVQIKYSTN
ncbi:MAG: chromosome condensation regulator repeat protein [Bacteriovoracaceae bacterium]|nr:chromosome condensation regulator repeat protein [Bacteriovoracaceae bacterium]